MAEATRATVLVVDDYDLFRAFVRDALGDSGLAVREVGTGADALTAIAARPDLVLLDVHLPDLSGLEILRRMRQDPALAHIPVVLVSGVDVSDDAVAQGLEGGADAYLTKPMRERQLRATVETLLRARRAEQSLHRAEARYHALVERIPAIAYVGRLDGARGTVYVSPQLKRLGFTPEEWLADPAFWSSRVHPGDRERVLAALAESAATGAPFEVEYRLLARDGRVVWLSDAASVVPDESGRHLLIQGVMLDVTERKRSEEARTRETSLAADIGSALTLADDLPAALQRCAEAFVRRLDVAFARIWTLDEAAQLLELQASAGMYTHLDGAHARVRVGELKIGRIAETRRPHLTNAVLTDPQISDLDWARRERMVAFAGHPLLVGERLVGVLAMFSRQPLDERVLAMLEPAATVIALGIDRMRTAEALRRAGAELNGALLGTSLELPQVLRSLAETARAVLRADVVRIWLREESDPRVTLRAQAGLAESAARAPRSLAFGEGFAGRMMLQPEVVALADARSDPRIQGREWFAAEGFISFLGVPLVIAEEPVGSFTCLTRAPRGWSSRDIEGARTLANHAAVAIRNARLFEQSERRRRTAEGLAGTSRLLAGTLDTSAVAERIAESLLALLHVRMARIFQADPASGDLVAVATAPGAAPGWNKTTFPAGNGLIGHSIREGRPVSTPDLLDDPRISYPEGLRVEMAATSVRAALAVPLHARAAVIGAVIVGDVVGRVFDDEEIAHAQAFADHAAVAFETARLYEQSRAQVAELQRLASELMETGRAREEFLVNVSHDLGTPFTAIRAIVETLSADASLDPTTRGQFVAILSRQVERLSRLIANILDASRLELGRLDYVMTAMDLDLVAADVVRAVGVRRHVTHESAGPLPVKGDRDRLTQALLNLVDNADKFSPPGEQVLVRTSREDGRAVVRVFDRGPGIPVEQEGALFQKFGRVRRPGHASVAGSGLGLYLAGEIAKAHGGAIAFERRHGWGAVFAVGLPLSEEAS